MEKLEVIISSEINQTQKDQSCISLICGSVLLRGKRVHLVIRVEKMRGLGWRGDWIMGNTTR